MDRFKCSGSEMTFSHDTTAALILMVDLVNTLPGKASETDGLPDTAALEGFLDAHRVVRRHTAGPADLGVVWVLRQQLLASWETVGQPTLLAAIANDLPKQSDARPWLTDHDGSWHLHVSEPDAPLLHRIAAQVGFALADLVRLGETGRLRWCLAPECQAVLVDLSRNRSRMYCDTGNCGNRQHVAAYRARRQSSARHLVTTSLTLKSQLRGN
jgi:predicted RNA-binding Zn ribbon-like protein